MKRLRLLLPVPAILLLASCGGDKGRAPSVENGRTIFMPGRDGAGTVVQDMSKSQMQMLMGCADCHGSSGLGGGTMMGVPVPSIRYRDLSDPAKHQPPYDEALVRRWLDEELKSDGTPGNTG